MPRREHTWYTSPLTQYSVGDTRRGESIPVVIKNRIPFSFLKASSIHCSQPIEVVDTKLIRCESDDRSVLLVSSVKLSVLPTLEPNP